MKNFLRKLHIGEGSGDGCSSSSPPPLPCRKGSNRGVGVHRLLQPHHDQRQRQGEREDEVVKDRVIRESPEAAAERCGGDLGLGGGGGMIKDFLRKLHIGDGSSAGGSLTVSSWLDSVPTRPPPLIPVEAEVPTTSATVGVEERQPAAAERGRRSEQEEEVEERVILETSEAEERKRRQEEDELEAYHTQLALEMSQWDNNQEEEMGVEVCPPQRSPAEVLADSYWNSGVLGYDDKVSDGFYDLIYVGHGEAASGAMPSVAELRNQPFSHEGNWEAVLVHTGEDSELMKIKEEALVMAVELRSKTSEYVGNTLVQRLASLVARHMGGAFDPESMSVKYQNMLNSLRSSIQSVVVPLGQLKIGLPHHRALLFKVLADELDVPCRLLKGRQHTGLDDGALNIVKFKDEREFIVDLVDEPGTLIPSDGVVSYNHQLHKDDTTNLLGSSNGASSRHDNLEVVLEDQSVVPCDLRLQYLIDITDNFSSKREVGRGGFGVVYKGMLPNGAVVAVKNLVSMAEIQDKQFKNEIDNLMRVRHPNIVRFVGYCYETRMKYIEHNGKHIFAESPNRLLCFEYVPNGSLDRYISEESHGLDWHKRYTIIRGICCGLNYLHEDCQINGSIVHLDLKPANILLDDHMVPKIADFGLSKLFGDQKTRTYATLPLGSLGYMAPEYLFQGIITTKADIYSLGVIIIEIVAGSKISPYDTGESRNDFVERVLRNWRNRLEASPSFTSIEIYCQQIKTCLEIGLSCVKADPRERPSIREIIEGFDK